MTLGIFSLVRQLGLPPMSGLKRKLPKTFRKPEKIIPEAAYEHTTYTSDDINISFPYIPYDGQKTMMDSVPFHAFYNDRL
jgi:hypothetical protein